MQKFLSLDFLLEDSTCDLIKLALEYKQKKYYPRYPNITAANLFFEPSTRTQYSFIRAEQNLGMQILNFSSTGSSMEKGESIEDTIKTFEALGTDIFIIRNTNSIPVINKPTINAGEGITLHPTQTLLDMMTIYEHFGRITGLKILIVGDCNNSRVAYSDIKILEACGNEMTVSGPYYLIDKYKNLFIPFDCLSFKQYDVIMVLRPQLERGTQILEDYYNKYAIKKEHVDIMRENSIIMHPGPVTRGVEIESKIVDCEKSKIFTQMENGVYARMTILKELIRGNG